VRLAPDADSPRSVTPCVVGFATAEEVRRNKLNPGTERSWSSRRSAGAVARLVRSSDVTLLSMARRVVELSAETLIASAIAAGLSSNRMTPAGSVTTWVAGANPSAVARTATSPEPAGTAADHVPSAAVVTASDRDQRALHGSARRVDDYSADGGRGRRGLNERERKQKLNHASGFAMKR